MIELSLNQQESSHFYLFRLWLTIFSSSILQTNLTDQPSNFLYFEPFTIKYLCSIFLNFYQATFNF